MSEAAGGTVGAGVTAAAKDALVGATTAWLMPAGAGRLVGIGIGIATTVGAVALLGATGVGAVGAAAGIGAALAVRAGIRLGANGLRHAMGATRNAVAKVPGLRRIGRSKMGTSADRSFLTGIDRGLKTFDRATTGGTLNAIEGAGASFVRSLWSGKGLRTAWQGARGEAKREWLPTALHAGRKSAGGPGVVRSTVRYFRGERLPKASLGARTVRAVPRNAARAGKVGGALFGVLSDAFKWGMMVVAGAASMVYVPRLAAARIGPIHAPRADALARDGAPTGREGRKVDWGRAASAPARRDTSGHETSRERDDARRRR